MANTRKVLHHRQAMSKNETKITKEKLYKWFKIGFVLLSLWVWSCVMAQNAQNMATKNHGEDAGILTTNLVGEPSKIAVFVLGLWIMCKLSPAGRSFAVAFFGWINTLLYLAEPDKLFRWVRKNGN